MSSPVPSAVIFDEAFIAVSDAAAFAGVTPQAVRAWIRHGRVPGYKIAGRLHVKECDLVAWLSPVRVDPQDAT